jgi:hypothetical protein
MTTSCQTQWGSSRSLTRGVLPFCLGVFVVQVIGLLPLRELCLDSYAYRQHPSMPRPQYSHLDNDGIKGLVDSICSRMRTGVYSGCFLPAPHSAPH